MGLMMSRRRMEERKARLDAGHKEGVKAEAKAEAAKPVKPSKAKEEKVNGSDLNSAKQSDSTPGVRR